MDGQLTRPYGDNPFTIMTRRLSARLKAFYYTSRLHDMRLKGNAPLKLITAPNNPWVGEVGIGAQIITNVFSYGGHQQTTSDNKPWPETANAPEMFYNWLYGFSWLSDLDEMADKRLAQEKAETLLKYWIAHHKSWSARAWKPELIGERLTTWILHSPLILSNSDLVYRSSVINCLVGQARHLNYVVATAPMGVPRVKASVGLAISGLLIPDSEERFTKAMKVLNKTLDSFILPDGGVTSRNPRDGIEVLKSLIILMKVLDSQNRERPSWLQFSCDKLVPFLRALSHGDGGFAHFGGAFANDSRDLKKIIELSNSKGRASNNLPFVGYQRLKKHRTLIIANVGPPPEPSLSHAAAANALAIEVSDGNDRIIVGSGGTLPDFDGKGEYAKTAKAQMWARNTSAHSTAVFAGDNSSNIQAGNAIGRAAFETSFERHESEEGIWLEASHNGYEKKYNTIHTRRIFINNEGTDIRGEDTLTRGVSGLAKIFASKTPLPVKIHFHIHPSISLSPNQAGNSIILRLQHGHGWLFQAKGGEIELEDSVYSQEPSLIKNTSQISLNWVLGINQTLQFKWSLKRLDHKE